MLNSLPEKFTGLPWVKCPPWARFMPSTVSPGLHAAKYTAMLAWEPECGWTLAYSQPKSCLARSMAMSSAWSTNSQPP